MQMIRIYWKGIRIRSTNFWPTFNSKGQVSVCGKDYDLLSIKSSVSYINNNQFVIIKLHIK